MRDLNLGLTCPICWLLMSDPVDLDCGHNFCDACITNWTKMVGEMICPACQKVSLLKTPNSGIASMVEQYEDLSSSSDDE